MTRILYLPIILGAPTEFCIEHARFELGIMTGAPLALLCNVLDTSFGCIRLND